MRAWRNIEPFMATILRHCATWSDRFLGLRLPSFRTVAPFPGLVEHLAGMVAEFRSLSKLSYPILLSDRPRRPHIDHWGWLAAVQPFCILKKSRLSGSCGGISWHDLSFGLSISVLLTKRQNTLVKYQHGAFFPDTEPPEILLCRLILKDELVCFFIVKQSIRHSYKYTILFWAHKPKDLDTWSNKILV